MPIGSSDGMYYEDDFDRVQGVGKPIRPQITITREQPRTDDPIGTFIENELGRTQAPMPRPDPRGSRPTYEEGDTIPGSDSYGNQSLGGPEYKRPLLPAPDDQSNTPLYNPERDSLTPPSMSKVSDVSERIFNADEVTPEKKQQMYKGAVPVLAGDEGLDSKDGVINLLNEEGKIRVWPGHPGVQDLLKNLPDDVEVYHLHEFGRGQENNTIILRKLPRLDELTSSKRQSGQNDLSLSPEGSSQDASQSHINDRTRDLSMRDMVREGANWIKSKTGIGERSFVGDFVQGLKDNGEVIGKFLRGEISKEDPEFTKAVVGLTSDLGLGGVTTAPLRAANSAGIFGGILGARQFGTAAETKLAEAQYMHREGASTVDTFKKTGWFYDRVSNKFKFEIPDTSAKLIKEPSQSGNSLGSVVEHPWLFKAYPELKDLPINYNKEMDDAIAKFHWDGRIEVGPEWKSLNKEKRTAILLHEIQHYVQTKEEFFKDMIVDSKFKPPEEFTQNVKDAEKAVQKLMSSKDADTNTLSSILNFIAESKKWLTEQENIQFQKYWDSPREREARLVEQKYLASKGQERDY